MHRKSGIKRIVCSVLILVMSGLVLMGCDMTRGLREKYTKEEAGEELKTGAERMDEWIRANCPDGKSVNMENSFWELPNGPIFLSGFVEGEFSDGKETYDYWLNVNNGELYFDPGNNLRQEFHDECFLLVKESLGVDELITDKDEYSNMSFVLSMGAEDWIMDNKADKQEAETNDSLKKSAMESWLSKVRLPASLVLSDGDVKEFVRDRDRKDLIVVGMNVYVPEGTDLTGYTVEKLESIEKEYGIFFERLILQTDKEIMDFNQNGEERNVYIESR